MVERGKRIFSIAVSATLLGVPVFGLPGPGHHGSPSAGGQAVLTSDHRDGGDAHGQGNAYGHDQGGSFGHDQGNGGTGNGAGGQGNAYGHDQGNGAGGQGSGAASQGNATGTQGNDQGYTHSPWTPPGPSRGHGHSTPPGAGQQSAPTPPPATPADPPATQPSTPSGPNITSAQGNGNGNSQGNGNGQGNSQGVPTDGPGDAHGVAHANGNQGGPSASRQGQGGSISTPCDGLCHGGQNPSLTPATTLATPVVAVASTPTPPVVTPTVVTPPATPTVSVPTIPITQPIRVPNFSSPSTASLLVGPGRRGGIAATPGIAALLAGRGAAGLASVTLGGAGGGGLTGLAGLVPPTGAVGFTPVAAATGTTGTAPTGAHAGTGHHKSGGSQESGTQILFIPRFINHIPEAVWLALAASLALAAMGAGAAFVSRRRAAAQAGELAAVSAAALTDALTGVLNRRGFVEAVERELARARRYHHPFVLAYVDVRGLKSVNDTEGHLTGDTLLKNVAALLTDCARADDVVGRLGGDELGLLLVEQTPDAAKAVTRRIETQVDARRKAMNLGSHWDLTIGTAAFPQDGQSVDELLGTADRRLYQQRGIQLADSR